MRSIAPARWMAAAALLGACSFMAPNEREYSGGLRDAGAHPSDAASDETGGAGSVATKQRGTSAGGSSAGMSSGAGFPGVGAVGGSTNMHPIGNSVLIDAAAPNAAGGAAPVDPPKDAGPVDPSATDGATSSCAASCGAPFARATCVSSGCQRTCTAGYADCNHDLDLGSSGSGCETHIASDRANCGACGAPCAVQNQDAVFCDTSLCKRYAVTVTNGTAGPVRGGDGGLPFAMPCAANEVVIGVHGLIGADSVYGFGADCARLEIHPNGTSYMLAVVATSTLPVVGGYPSTQTDQTTFTLPCPESTVVTAVSGATWPPWSDDRICVKQLTLKCTAISIDSSRKITLGPTSSNVTAGKTDATSTAFPADACAGLGVVRGFTGMNGNLIDDIRVQCGVISLATQTQKMTSKGWLSDVVDTVNVAD
jgi:hypothetical protein